MTPCLAQQPDGAHSHVGEELVYQAGNEEGYFHSSPAGIWILWAGSRVSEKGQGSKKKASSKAPPQGVPVVLLSMVHPPW